MSGDLRNLCYHIYLMENKWYTVHSSSLHPSPYFIPFIKLPGSEKKKMESVIIVIVKIK